jgi:hypothetical protein
MMPHPKLRNETVYEKEESFKEGVSESEWVYPHIPNVLYPSLLLGGHDPVFH